jgi:hypothetical protein
MDYMKDDLDELCSRYLFETMTKENINDFEGELDELLGKYIGGYLYSFEIFNPRGTLVSSRTLHGITQSSLPKSIRVFEYEVIIKEKYPSLQ